MSAREYDLVIVGSGPGGYVAAIRASQLGLKTAVVEKDRLGGVCLNWGCIPSKSLLTNARVYNKIRNAEEWGIRVGEISFDIEKIIGRSREVADAISKGVAYLMKKNKIDVVEGCARLAGPGRLEVLDSGGKGVASLKASHIVLATGARARALPGVEIDGATVITSRHALELARIPKPFQGTAIGLVTAGLMALSFSGFAGLVK